MGETFLPPNHGFGKAYSMTTDDCQLATPKTRLIATFVDGLTLGTGMAIFFGLTGALTGVTDPDSHAGQSGMWTMGLCLFYLAIVIGIHIFLLYKAGQTIGKRIMGIRITRPDGSHPSLWRSLALRYVLNGFLIAIPLYALIDPAFILQPERRCLHDYLAGTIVIKA